MDVLTVGETMVMVTPEAGGRLGTDGRFLLRPGGAESNVAALLARLGHHAAWASALGTDPLGDLIVRDLERHGVDVSLVRRDERRPTAVYFKDPTPDGTRVYYYRAGSAASAITTTDVGEWTAHAPRLVHVSGITAALSAQAREAARALVRRPGLVSFDVNHRAQLWSGDAPEVLLELAQDADIVFVGRDEAETLWGTATAEDVRGLIDRPQYLIVKDAAIEAVAFTPTGVHREPSTKVTVVDAVGAGDAFAAGWLSGFLDGRDEPARLRLGHYAAARVLESPSDFAELPPAAEIVAELG
ncbi:sugar kinase [Amycolatopsis thermophila]|uniref:2-dehydro-3-deoxygluconokinase n=1 Tax=Amycolatopsis thermophila TaxID=206084 RepID=A0ABU0EVX0_9PSEU|nr:sugar kinase [Amycolatopsis thermophila]MDQ0379469.1 2-dehydro-3-deoxygluconokinase [Amycolatopsis thermophila]